MSTLLKAATEFQHSLLARRVAVRFAMEHATPEAMKDYLHEHPDADPGNHTVKKEEKDEGGGKEKGGEDSKVSPKDAKKAHKSTLDGEKSKAKLNRLKSQMERVTSYRHNDPEKAKEVAGKLVDEGKKHLQNAEESLKHIESLSGKVDKRDVDELKSMIKEMKASIDRHEFFSSKDKNLGFANDISDDGDRLQHALSTALYAVRSAK